MPVNDLPLTFDVGSGAGGALSAARLSGQCDERSRLSATWRNWRSGLPTAGASFANWRRVWISSVESRTAVSPAVDMSPSERNDGRDAWENGPSRLKKVVRLGAARWRSLSSGFCWFVRSFSRAIVGFSSLRKPGSFLQPSVIAVWRVAETSEIRRADVTQRASSFLFTS